MSSRPTFCPSSSSWHMIARNFQNWEFIQREDDFSFQRGEELSLWKRQEMQVTETLEMKDLIEKVEFVWSHVSQTHQEKVDKLRAELQHLRSSGTKYGFEVCKKESVIWVVFGKTETYQRYQIGSSILFGAGLMLTITGVGLPATLALGVGTTALKSVFSTDVVAFKPKDINSEIAINVISFVVMNIISRHSWSYEKEVYAKVSNWISIPIAQLMLRLIKNSMLDLSTHFLGLYLSGKRLSFKEISVLTLSSCGGWAAGKSSAMIANKLMSASGVNLVAVRRIVPMFAKEISSASTTCVVKNIYNSKVWHEGLKIIIVTSILNCAAKGYAFHSLPASSKNVQQIGNKIKRERMFIEFVDRENKWVVKGKRCVKFPIARGSAKEIPQHLKWGNRAREIVSSTNREYRTDILVGRAKNERVTTFREGDWPNKISIAFPKQNS
ncbi:MAG: hypothetical protein ACXU9U_00590 [Parachlamydiaceae bacterium]